VGFSFLLLLLLFPSPRVVNLIAGWLEREREKRDTERITEKLRRS
jgi:hypothetical protein